MGFSERIDTTLNGTELNKPTNYLKIITNYFYIVYMSFDARYQRLTCIKKKKKKKKKMDH